MQERQEEDCLPCKAISVCSLLGIGSYLVFRGKTQSPLSKYSMYTLGLAIASLGVGEIFDKSPFR